MSISHYRLSRIEQRVGINVTKLFVFSAPCAWDGKPEFNEDDFLRLTGRERQQGDMVVVLMKFYDPADPDRKAATVFGSPISEVALLSASELRDEVSPSK